MSRIKITKKELATWHELFPRLVAYIQKYPEAAEGAVINIAVLSELVSRDRVVEWLGCTVEALYHDGTIIARDVDVLIGHMRALSPDVLGSIADRVVRWAMGHPMPFMAARARKEIHAEFDRWYAEPDQIENIEKIMELERLGEELVRLVE